MCGRFMMSLSEGDIRIRFNVSIYDDFYRPSFNCAPSQKLACITQHEPEKLSMMKWGIIPVWQKSVSKAVINARSETLAEKPFFKRLVERNRCIIPANGFFEWKQENVKIPYRICMADESAFAMAGIYESRIDDNGNQVNSFAIITTTANELMKPIHNRMPVILFPEEENRWLLESQSVENFLKPFPSELMRAYRISSLINSPAYNSPKIIEPQTDSQTKLF